MGGIGLMLALVTGANGFVGRRLVEDLLAQGVRVRAMVRPGKGMVAMPGAEIVEANLNDADAVLRAVTGCDLIYHCAALCHGSNATLQALRLVNVEGTRNVAKAAIATGVKRLVYTSTGAVYGRAVRRHGIDEETPAAPDSPYGLSKLEGEAVVQSMPDLAVVIARTVTVWGPGMKSWADLFRLVSENRFRMAGNGTGMFLLTHISDFSDGLIRCGTVPGIEGRTYVITGKEALPLRKVMELIAEFTGAHPIRDGIPEAPIWLYRALDQMAFRFLGKRVPKADRLDFFLGDRTFKIGKAQRELGYEPKYSAREIVRTTAESLGYGQAIEAVRTDESGK